MPPIRLHDSNVLMVYIKKLFLYIFTIITIFASISANAENTYRPKSNHTYITGPKGGCYYINSHGNKTYVDRALCKSRAIEIKKSQEKLEQNR
ncbi:protein of unknown function [Candidatus Nitrotoga arctica]|uniref:Secreted protein n=1 Tax=Candidatus Nitrotoga arctica TaxID=453162 RepID=A0ABM8Z280_9PROT|nr:protein of unknown function [Candidatus Nitrotoga arctica]